MNAPILLDTCAAMWLVDGTLGGAAADILAESYRAGQMVFVSPFTAWEIGSLASSGRFRSSLSPESWLESLMSLPGVAIAELTSRILMQAWLLPGKLNRDPADRIIAATAREYGFTVMTRDRALLAYAQEGYLSAFAC